MRTKKYQITINLDSIDNVVKLTQCFDSFLQARIVPHKLRYKLDKLEVVEVNRED